MKHASIFSGLGGFDLAAEWMGWDNVFSCEINPFCNTILKYYWPHAIHYTDIRQTDFTPWRGKVDILTGGFPCQPFSSAGKRKGTDDDRYLWPEMLRAIREIQPTWIIGENVRGLVTWNDGMVFEQVCADLEAEGYEVQPFIIPAAGVNAPHRRERIWFIAYSNCHGTWVEEPRDSRQEGSGFSENHQSTLVRQKERATGTERTEQFSTPQFTSDAESQRCGKAGCSQCGSQKRDNGHGGERFTTNSQNRDEGLASRSKPTQSGPSISCQIGNVTYSSIPHAGFNEETNSGGLENRQSLILADATDTNSGFGSEGRMHPNRPEPTKRYAGSFDARSIRRAWENFPTQSPLRSRDDGFPAPLDGITVSKLRTESIKGFGNAIVPEVAYRLFQAILFS